MSHPYPYKTKEMFEEEANTKQDYKRAAKEAQVFGDRLEKETNRRIAYQHDPISERGTYTGADVKKAIDKTVTAAKKYGPAILAAADAGIAYYAPYPVKSAYFKSRAIIKGLQHINRSVTQQRRPFTRIPYRVNRSAHRNYQDRLYFSDRKVQNRYNQYYRGPQNYNRRIKYIMRRRQGWKREEAW